MGEGGGEKEGFRFHGLDGFTMISCYVKQMLYFHIEMLNPWFSTTYIKSIEKPRDKAVVFWLHYV